MAKKSTVYIARAGIFSALYIVLSLIVFPFASGAIQVRLGEALTLLPLLFPEAIASLFIGCVLVNVITGCALIDVFFGAFITLVSAVLTFLVGRAVKSAVLKITLGGIFPILLNAFLLPLIWYFCYGELEYVYIIQVLFVLLGQTVSIYGLGSIMYLAIERSNLKKIL